MNFICLLFSESKKRNFDVEDLASPEMRAKKFKKKHPDTSKKAVGNTASEDGSSFDKDNNIEAGYDETSSDASEP